MEELNKELLPKHIAIIMDGNRRWAKQRNFGQKCFKSAILFHFSCCAYPIIVVS